MNLPKNMILYTDWIWNFTINYHEFSSFTSRKLQQIWISFQNMNLYDFDNKHFDFLMNFKRLFYSLVFTYFCMTTISRYRYITFFIYVTDKSCIHTFTAKYCWKYFVADIFAWQIAFTDISRILFMLQINRVYILLQQKYMLNL